MEKNKEKAINDMTETKVEKEAGFEGQSPKKASKTWEAMMRLKGSLIVNDPKFLL